MVAKKSGSNATTEDQQMNYCETELFIEITN